jgi:oxygen-independent coproporphyrinogen-3 oxidase
MTLLTPAERVFDFMLNALRLNDGFDEAIFEQRTGLSGSDLIEAAGSAMDKGLIQRSDGLHWRPTELGGRFLNDLQAEFIVEKV